MYQRDYVEFVYEFSTNNKASQALVLLEDRGFNVRSVTKKRVAFVCAFSRYNEILNIVTKFKGQRQEILAKGFSKEKFQLKVKGKEDGLRGSSRDYIR